MAKDNKLKRGYREFSVVMILLILNRVTYKIKFIIRIWISELDSYGLFLFSICKSRYKSVGQFLNRIVWEILILKYHFKDRQIFGIVSCVCGYTYFLIQYYSYVLLIRTSNEMSNLYWLRTCNYVFYQDHNSFHR